jgi:hypothetical protein
LRQQKDRPRSPHQSSLDSRSATLGNVRRENFAYSFKAALRAAPLLRVSSHLRRQSPLP